MLQKSFAHINGVFTLTDIDSGTVISFLRWFKMPISRPCTLAPSLPYLVMLREIYEILEKSHKKSRNMTI